MDGTRGLNRLARHEERLVSLWESLAETLGIHTARVLLMRAILQTEQAHPDLALIHWDDAGLSFDALFGALQDSFATRTQEEIVRAFIHLHVETLRLLERLLGRELAQEVAQRSASLRATSPCSYLTVSRRPVATTSATGTLTGVIRAPSGAIPGGNHLGRQSENDGLRPSGAVTVDAWRQSQSQPDTRGSDTLPRAHMRHMDRAC